MVNSNLNTLELSGERDESMICGLYRPLCFSNTSQCPLYEYQGCHSWANYARGGTSGSVSVSLSVS